MYLYLLHPGKVYLNVLQSWYNMMLIK